MIYVIGSRSYSFSDKQRSYMISLSMTTTTLLAYILHLRPSIIVQNMLAGFMMDLLVGHFAYPSLMGWLEGYVHHVMYIGFLSYILCQSEMEQYYMSQFAIEEFPTWIMGLKVMFHIHPSHYYSLLIISFVQFRILLHIYLICNIPDYFVYLHGPTYPIALLSTLGLHVYWASKMIRKSRHTSSLWLTLPAFILNTQISPVSNAILVILPYCSHIHHVAQYDDPDDLEYLYDRFVIILLNVWSMLHSIPWTAACMLMTQCMSYHVQEKILKVVFVGNIARNLWIADWEMRFVIVIGCIYMWVGFFTRGPASTDWGEMYRHLWHFGVVIYLLGGHVTL